MRNWDRSPARSELARWSIGPWTSGRTSSGVSPVRIRPRRRVCHTGAVQPLGVHDVSINADAIPVVETPPGGYGDTFPDPVLATCTESIVDGAPDMHGLWKVVEVLVDGAARPEHRILDGVQRIEQCGDRVVITAGGIIHDMRCDSTEANGVNDVAEFDKATPITVVATFEDGVHVLRTVGVPIEVKRWLARCAGPVGITVLDGFECWLYQHGLRHMAEIKLARSLVGLGGMTS